MTRHVCVNVGRGRPKRQRRAFRRVLYRLLVWPGTLTGWQEIGEADGPNVDEPRLLRRAFPKASGWRNIAVGTHTPISVNWLVWKIEDITRLLAMEGIPRQSPHRYVVAVRLTKRRGRDRHPLTRINTHMVRDPHGSKRRRHGWWEHWKQLRGVVAAEHDAGRDQVLSIDANRHWLPELHPEAVTVWQRGVDRLIAIPAPGRRVDVRDAGKMWLGIDGHQAGYADLRFTDA